MTDPDEPLDTILADLEDPRLTAEFLRTLPATDDLGWVAVVGVVHDHPASVYRAGRLVELLQPATLAVELPAAAIPLFESLGSEEADHLGGEMSEALSRARGKKVGIDAPSLLYAVRLFAYLRAERVPPIVYWRVLEDLARSAAQATWTLVVALVAALTGRRFEAYSPIEHESTRQDTPAEQASAEREHLATRRAFLDAIAVPRRTRIIDTVRERVMTEQIADLRRDGTVMAVVGFEHLDPIAQRLEVGSG